mgnify:FL=1
MPSVQNKRGTRAQLNAAATANQLKIGEIYLITDEDRLAVGTSVNTYQDFSKLSELDAKQDALVSGTNIKTINGSSVLGSGDLVVSGTVSGFFAPTVDELTSTQQSTSTALANVTQLVEPMVANGIYNVDCFVTFRSASTTAGINFGFTSPTGTNCQLEVVVPITSVAASTQLRTIFPNAGTATNVGNVLGTGVTAINSNHTARISGIVHCGATAGNFQIQFATETNGQAITLQIGSSMFMQRVA